MNDVIGIALATYNGSEYIDVMLDSINSQSFQDFHIHICDDGSQDNTIEIIKSSDVFKRGKLTVHEVDGGNGAMLNFRRTISYCGERYIALCDQDDFWHKDKLKIMLDRIREVEFDNIPTLVFSDLDIVDKHLISLHHSFFKSSSKSSLCSNPQDFMINNHVPGCAMMFNRISKEYFEEIPVGVRMHDWWIIFIISLYGVIDYIDLPLIKYRQHENNTIGVPGINGKSSFFRQVRELRNLSKALKKSSTMKGFIFGWVELHPEFKLNENGELFIRKMNGGILGRIFLFKMSHPGESFLSSLLIWCLL